MGLDQYAYVAAKQGQLDEYWQQDADATAIAKPREIAYWRKHPNLQGWMEQRWLDRDNTRTDKTFNGVELELSWQDLDELERAVIHGQLPKTSGFFFGDGADDYYREKDLEFIKNARAELFLGLKVFYNSSW